MVVIGLAWIPIMERISGQLYTYLQTVQAYISPPIAAVFLLGVFFLGSLLKGVGALVCAIGLGQIAAGYLYPNTSEELTNAVENYEKK